MGPDASPVEEELGGASGPTTHLLVRIAALLFIDQGDIQLMWNSPAGAACKSLMSCETGIAAPVRYNAGFGE
jgi:hypothetical protein